jgi:RimJ/RimL family protein N-acetyltransferase
LEADLHGVFSSRQGGGWTPPCGRSYRRFACRATAEADEIAAKHLRYIRAHAARRWSTTAQAVEEAFLMITLREFAESDIDEIVRLANNEQVARYLADRFPHPYTRADAAWWVHHGATENGAINRAIAHRGTLVGGIGIDPQTGWRAHVGAIGYWIGQDYWGQGIATQALREMTDIGFRDRCFRKLVAQVLAPNIASMRVLEKAGYAREAVLAAEVRKGGTYFDAHQFARHREP